MKEIAQWLVHIEHLAANFYGNAAMALKNDEPLSRFLSHLAEEEKYHGAMIGLAADYLADRADIAAAIRLDDPTRDRIEGPFLDCGSRLGSDSLTREHVINCVVSVEYSEWNDIFLYVINSLKVAGKEFSFSASKMQSHKGHIESFISSLPEGEQYINIMRRLPPLWRSKILVVEDDDGVRELLTTVLSAEGDVETARNGKAALELVQTKHFDVIVSDVDMPVMNGIAFYRSAVEREPHVRERTLFLSGFPSDETLAFFEKNGLRYMQKPMLLNELQTAVRELLAHP